MSTTLDADIICLLNQNLTQNINVIKKAASF